MKPSDFFLGLFDFFAIVLPGAILTYLLVVPRWPPELIDFANRPLSEPGARWAAFAVASYALGHLLHSLGGFLDEHYYDRRYGSFKRFKTAEELPYMARLVELLARAKAEVKAAEKKLKAAKKKAKAAEKKPETAANDDVATTEAEVRDWERAVKSLKAALKAGPPTPYYERAVALIRAERAVHLPGFDPPKENLFTWVSAALRLRNPTAAAELERAGVDSKFFRSLVLVSGFAAVWLPGVVLLPAAIEVFWFSYAMLAGCAAFAGLCWLLFEWNWGRFTWLALVWPVAWAVAWGVPGTETAWPDNTWPAIVSCVLSLVVCRMSYERYCARRWSATEDAYRYFILNSIPQPAAPCGSKTP